MGKKIIKMMVSIATGISILLNAVSICSAYTISVGDSTYIGSKYVYKGIHDYEYTVSYVYFDGLSVGAFIPGLVLRAEMNNDTDYVCSINSTSKSGTYSINKSGVHTYRLYNNSAKHVSIAFSYINY